MGISPLIRFDKEDRRAAANKRNKWKRVAVVKRDGKDALVEAIPAKDHGQLVNMRGYDNPSSHMHTNTICVLRTHTNSKYA